MSSSKSSDSRVRYARLLDEFPTYGLANIPPVPIHWRDESWHNDVCPSFVVAEKLDGSYLRAWLNFKRPSDREFPEAKRFEAYWYSADAMDVGESVASAETFGPFCAQIELALKAARKSGPLRSAQESKHEEIVNRVHAGVLVVSIVDHKRVRICQLSAPIEKFEPFGDDLFLPGLVLSREASTPYLKLIQRAARRRERKER
jgi:hypothetical protein